MFSQRIEILRRTHSFFLARRVKLLIKLMKLDQASRVQSILDLGGGDGELALRLKRKDIDASLTVADIYTALPPAQSGIRFVRLQEDKLLPFVDGEFDLVICNAVIEHVTLPKVECMSAVAILPEREWHSRSLESQRIFANEIRRVSRSYFVQTPHHDFPIDTHLWLPFTNWWSHNWLVRLSRFTDRFWIKSVGGLVDWNLLRTAEMCALFPEAEIYIERWLGIPKSVIAYKQFE